MGNLAQQEPSHRKRLIAAYSESENSSILGLAAKDGRRLKHSAFALHTYQGPLPSQLVVLF